MIRDVLRYPDRRLKTPAVPLRGIGPEARRLAVDLVDTARHYPRTVGIAAPQVGALWRMVYIDCTGHRSVPDPAGPIVMVNPLIVRRDGSEIGREGCLSLPDITANVARATDVTVRYRTIDGDETELTTSGFEARVVLHEIDHLDGVLILDRVASLTLDVFPRKERSRTKGSGRP